MIMFYRNLTKTQQLQSRNPRQRLPVNMGRLSGCCKLLCAKYKTLIVIMLLTVKTLKTTCSNDQVAHHQHTRNQPQLNSFRATRNSSLEAQQQVAPDNHLRRRNGTTAPEGDGVRDVDQFVSGTQFLFERGETPARAYGYDFLGGLGEFIRLTLDELALDELEGDALQPTENKLGNKQLIFIDNDLSQVEPDERRLELHPLRASVDKRANGAHDPMRLRSMPHLRSRRDLGGDVGPHDERKQAKNRARRNVTGKIKAAAVRPSNQRLNQSIGGVQVIESVMPGQDEPTHARIPSNESPIKQDHLYDEQGAISSSADSGKRSRVKSPERHPEIRRLASSVAATTSVPTTTAPSLFNPTTRKGKRQSPSGALEEPGVGGDRSLEMEDLDLFGPDDGAALPDSVGQNITVESEESLDPDSVLIDGGGFPAAGSLGSHAELVDQSQAGDSDVRKPKRPVRVSNLQVNSEVQLSAQPPAASSMPSPSRQVPPPEQNPLKRTTARGLYNEPNHQLNNYSGDRNSANSEFAPDNPAEFDDIVAQYPADIATDLPRREPPRTDVGIMRNRQLEQRQQNSVNENEIMSSLMKDPDQLLQLLRMVQNADNGNKKPKKSHEPAAADDTHKPNQPQQVLENPEEQLRSAFLNQPFSLAAPYAAFNQSDLYGAPAVSFAGDQQQPLIGVGSTRAQQTLGNYDQINEQQNAALSNFNLAQARLVQPPIGTITIQAHAPQMAQANLGSPPPRISAELRNKLEESFYNSNTNLRHNKRALSDMRARQAAQQLGGEPTLAGGWSHPFAKSKPSRHQSSLVLNTAHTPPGKYLYRPKPLQVANSYMHPSRNDPLQDSSQPDSTGYQTVAHSAAAVAQGQVLGMLRAGPSLRAPGSGQLVRRALPLASAQIRGDRLPPMPTTAYLLPAYPTPTIPFSGTSARYSRHLNGGSSAQRLWGQFGSPSRIGRLATSASLADEPATGAAATSDPMWSDTQSHDDDYQQAPQTIQITAVPNNGLVNNGFNNFAGGWNGWGGGPWNGRQVLLVNRQPTAEWRNWILPVAAVLSLPLVLGSLLVPVFLKSVMFLIQILQMLGFLMPPAQLAGQMSAIAHSPSSG